MTGKLLFLGYGEDRTRLVSAIGARGWRITCESGPVRDLSAWDLAVSFGYRHILRPDTLASARRPVLNLHIAYLPWNRGAHPNVWAHLEGAPSGVTIHEVDAGVDTGPICRQRRVAFGAEETTFASTHARLLEEAEDLFLTAIDALLDGTYAPRPQPAGGSYHAARDLPVWLDDWSMDVAAARARWDRERAAAQGGSAGDRDAGAETRDSADRRAD